MKFESIEGWDHEVKRGSINENAPGRVRDRGLSKNEHPVVPESNRIVPPERLDGST
jgi:hypothetical protein